MPVVHGDRVGESVRLNLRTPEAQDFYAHFVAVIPDDFRRFRLAPSLIATAMYPRREITVAILRRVERLLAQLGSGEQPLWKTWVVDGVTFAELTTGQDRGNRYHRTPEPPWSVHGHHGACVATAIARARGWGRPEEAARLSLLMKEFRDRKRTGIGTEGAPDPPPELHSPSPPSPPSPRTTTTPPYPPAPSAGGAHPNGGDPRATMTARAELRAARLQAAHRVEQAKAYIVANGGLAGPQTLRRLRQWARGGMTLAQMQELIDQGEHSPRRL